LPEQMEPAGSLSERRRWTLLPTCSRR
jgi:hypothetical protein